MGVILFWIHDQSPGRVRTRRFLERTLEIVVRLIELASNPLMLPLRKTTLKLLAEIKDSAK